ncbi:hypothetical protein FHX52_3498 [Humibacillus xanthopallidus]|uniref:DivIVA domain-containing protein n=1 Tax=Humibacillus xanthopallidus TaxID=412689 RepID=A0A543PRS6_9MICO|nr:DivIVA domain-containing protein [Humibacillus xanthopallidus]TQN46769.1 hypothetical protein FHX52_3498 [Humibacillus xanthopallidus]
MTWFILFVGVVVVCFIAALVLGLIGGSSIGGLGGETRSLTHEPLPDEPIADSDFDDLVFDVSLRGYRMSQVDGVVDRLRRELREKDEEIAVLRANTEAAAALPGNRESTSSAASRTPGPGPTPDNRESNPGSRKSASPGATEAPDGAEPRS